ncbi:hypothetical protein [Azorhizobium doebereinerae]|uniref:hypothetical protein n=1 Tax=Azorhizobium doebereinerae TaxID=281091 RepID=UPI00040C4307|nr:hypothetical protein [Azorhizobium doebereinerae]
MSSFRTSSTWLWQKFRAAPGALAYYEIFNEHLDVLTGGGAAEVNYQSWNSRHPPGAPYFIEFLPLLREGGGIRGFNARMAFESFIPQGGPSGDLAPAENDYVELLITNARALGKVPVLSCTRALGRARGLKQAFGGRMVFCFRNLFHQWASYCGQFAEGNPYFIETVGWTLKAARHDPFLALVDDFTRARTADPADPLLFQAFLLLHLYLYAQAFEASDLTVDVGALAQDADLRHETEAVLSRLLGTAVDLSDARPSFDGAPLPVSGLHEVRDGLEQFAKLIRASCRTLPGADFVEAITAATFEEWERHDFYAGRARARHGVELEAMRARAEAAERTGAALAAERQAQEQVIAQLHGEKNGFAAQVEALEGAQDVLRQEILGLTAARDDLSARLAAAEAAALQQQAEVAALTAERRAQADLMTDAAQARAAEQALVAEMQHLADAATARLEAELAALSAERESFAAQLAELERMRAAALAAGDEALAAAEREAEATQARLTARIHALEVEHKALMARPTGVVASALAYLRPKS